MESISPLLLANENQHYNREQPSLPAPTTQPVMSQQISREEIEVPLVIDILFIICVIILIIQRFIAISLIIVINVITGFYDADSCSC